MPEDSSSSNLIHSRYITLPSAKTYIFSPKALSPLLEAKNINGEVVRKELNESTLDEYYSIIEEYQKSKHGILFSHFMLKIILGIAVSQGYKRKRHTWFMERWWFAVAYDPEGLEFSSNDLCIVGKVVGMIVYLMNGLFKPMKVKYFFYFNSLGKFLLLRYLSLHIDQGCHLDLKTHPSSF